MNDTGDAAPEAWRRFPAYMIQAFRADRAEKSPPAPRPRAMYRALVRLHRAAHLP
ncbi:MAG TPA: hypothetical protein VHI50_02000 [Micromonosporaceae bacterium]|nr:hypothetical protein [Micromonosporaceae bacterium]